MGPGGNLTDVTLEVEVERFGRPEVVQFERERSARSRIAGSARRWTGSVINRYSGTGTVLEQAMHEDDVDAGELGQTA